MTCLLFRKGNKAKQFALYFYLLQTGSRSKHLRQFVFSPSLSYNGRKESRKIACQCQELRAFLFLTKAIQQQLLLKGWLQSLPGALLHLYSRDCAFSALTSSAEGRKGCYLCISASASCTGEGGLPVIFYAD